MLLSFALRGARLLCLMIEVANKPIFEGAGNQMRCVLARVTKISLRHSHPKAHRRAT